MPRLGILHVAGVGPERQQPEESAEHIFTLRDPRRHLDVEGMPREKGGDRGAAPESAGQLAQYQEDQHRVEGVKDKACGMMAARMQAVNLAIQRVRKPGQRLPDLALAGLESPSERTCQTLVDVGIVDYVGRVIVADKTEIERRRIKRDGA